MRRRRSGFAVGLAAAALCAFVSPAFASRPWLPRLTDLTAGDGRVSFRQPDGTYTIIDLAIVAVAERGGDPPEGWLPPPQCDIASSPCAFPGGMVALNGGREGWRLEGRTASGSWAADLTMPVDARPPQRIWAVGERLLLESPAFGTSTLECVDMASGRSLWVYFYPSPMSGPGFPGTHTSAARSAREALERASAFAGELGAAAHRGRIVLDPDPLRARAAARWLAAGWALLLAVVVAAFRLLREDAPGGLAIAIVAATAVLVVRFVFVDAVLALAFLIGFLIVAARGLRAARGWSRFFVGVVVVATVVLLVLALLLPSMIR